MSAAKNLARSENIALPIDVVAKIDKLVGKQGRSAFLAELVQRELELRDQREAIEGAAGAWKSEDHPELADGVDAWVRQIRSRDHKRFEELERLRDSE